MLIQWKVFYSWSKTVSLQWNEREGSDKEGEITENLKNTNHAHYTEKCERWCIIVLQVTVTWIRPKAVSVPPVELYVLTCLRVFYGSKGQQTMAPCGVPRTVVVATCPISKCRHASAHPGEQQFYCIRGELAHRSDRHLSTLSVWKTYWVCTTAVWCV